MEATLYLEALHQPVVVAVVMALTKPTVMV
jgi:hypothetical protein